MSPRPTEPERDPAGQHRLVGWALLGLGGGCALLSLGLVVTGTEMRFIDGPTMFLFSGVMAGVGWWQRGLAEAYEE